MVDYMDNQIRSLSFLHELKQHDCILNIVICKLADVISGSFVISVITRQ